MKYTVIIKPFVSGTGYLYTTEIDTLEHLCTAEEWWTSLDNTSDLTRAADLVEIYIQDENGETLSYYEAKK